MWGDNLSIDLNIDNVNLQNRYKYVINHIDDFGYMMSKTNCKKVGKVYVGICPLPTHKEKTGSFTIYPKGYTDNYGNTQDYASFYCFGCGEGGNVIRFKQLFDQLNNMEEACEELEKEHGIDIKDKNVLKSLLQESLETIKSNNTKLLDFNKINYICSSICRQYLYWIKQYYPNNLQEEFSQIQHYYKNFDDNMGNITMFDAPILIIKTEDMINKRKNILKCI